MTEARHPVTMALIKQCVAAHYQVTVTEMVSRRQGVASAPRQIAMYLAATLSVHSLPEIGAAFHRDHTTVMYARDIVKTRMANSSILAADIRKLRADILAAANPPSPSETLAVRLVLDTAAVFRTAGLTMAASDPAATIHLLAPVAAAFGVTLPKEVT